KKHKKHIPSIQESSGPEINENTRDSFYDVDEEKTFPSLPNLEEGTIPFIQPQGENIEDLLPPQEKKQEETKESDSVLPSLLELIKKAGKEKEEKKEAFTGPSDAELMNMDPDKLYEEHKAMVPYSNGGAMVVSSKKQQLDITELIAKKLGFSSMYWSCLHIMLGDDLGVVVKEYKNENKDAKRSLTYQVSLKNHMDQCLGGALIPFTGGLRIALPITRGISFFNGPPFGNIGRNDKKFAAKYGEFNGAKFSGMISAGYNALPVDLIWDQEIPIPRLHKVMEWIEKCVEVPAATQLSNKLNDTHFKWRGLTKTGNLFWSSFFYQKFKKGDNLEEY